MNNPSMMDDMPVIGDPNTPPDARGDFAFTDQVPSDYQPAMAQQAPPATFVDFLGGSGIMDSLSTLENATVEGYRVSDMTEQEQRVALGYIITLCNRMQLENQQLNLANTELGRLVQQLRQPGAMAPGANAPLSTGE